MYILKCADDSFYTGSTYNLERRLHEHQIGKGANFTQKKLPITLAYSEYFERVEYAFQREQQIKGWSRKKKLALIENRKNDLIKLSRNYTEREEE